MFPRQIYIPVQQNDVKKNYQDFIISIGKLNNIPYAISVFH